VHLASGLLGVAAASLPDRTATVLLATAFAITLLVDSARLLAPPLARPLLALAGALYRPVEQRRLSGGTFLLAAYLGSWLLFTPLVAARAIVVAAVADPAASLVGSRWSRERGRKTWVGSAAAFAAAFAVLLAWRTALPVAALVALVAAFAERVPGAGLDNVTVPLATAAALALGS
jgi:dolichol kinase